MRLIFFWPLLLCIFERVHTANLAPFEVTCPEYDLIREVNNSICQEEEKYVRLKKSIVGRSLKAYLESLEQVVFDDVVLQAVQRKPPIIGLAISGGGYRSMLTSTGFVKEMEEYGLFDCLSYISGLSGGSWVLMDLIIHNFEVNLMLNDWNLDDGLLQGIPDFDFKKDVVSGMGGGDFADLEQLYKRSPEMAKSLEGLLASNQCIDAKEIVPQYKRDYSIMSKFRNFLFPGVEDNNSTPENTPPFLSALMNFQRVLNFYIELHQDVRPKKIEGFHVTFTDYLGKAFTKHLTKTPTDGINTTSLSQLVRNSDKFISHEAPVPIFVCNCKNKSLKNIIFEFNPFEFGSWDSILRLFVKLPYLGSRLEEGKVFKCFSGFDDIGFVTATSSSIFNNVLIYIWQLTAESSRETIRAIRSILSIFGLHKLTITPDEHLNSSFMEHLSTEYAVINPNPFYHYPGRKSPLTTEDFLYMVDGGEDGENIPLRPLAIPERNVDLIFIIDSSSDENNYPNGSKLRNVVEQMEGGERYKISQIDLTSNGPIALGCHERDIPLLIYQANREHSYPSNTSTFKITYNESEVFGMLQNGREIFNADQDRYYKNCLGCLLLKRIFDGIDGYAAPSFCSKCYQDFCQ